MKVINVDAENVLLGKEDSSTLSVKRAQVNFEPVVGDEVDLYGEGDEAIVIKKTDNAAPIVAAAQPATETGVKFPEQEGDTMLLVAFIFNLITTILVGWLILPLAWYIPITVMNYKAYKGERPNTIALGVVSLIFTNLIAGILLLRAPQEK
jgi:hypothetical protein